MSDDMIVTRCPDGTEVSFRPSDHTYHVGGIEMPSTSKIIEPMHDFRFVRPEVLEAAADLGHKIHKTVQLSEEKRLNRKSLHPLLEAHLVQWERVKGFLKFEPTAFEIVLHSKKWEYCGTMDTSGLLLPQTDFDETIDEVILDIKSGAQMAAHKLQTAGYKNAAVEQGIVSPNAKRGCIYLTQDSYEVVWHTSPYDLQAFIALRHVYYWKKHHGQSRNY